MINKTDAITLLIRFFDDNNLTFREMNTVKSVFEDAVEQCHTNREDEYAEYLMGRKPRPALPDRNVEDDFFTHIDSSIENIVSAHAETVSPVLIRDLTEFLVNAAEYKPTDFFK